MMTVEPDATPTNRLTNRPMMAAMICPATVAMAAPLTSSRGRPNQPKIRIGSVLKAYVPGLGGAIELKVDYIAVQAEYATWSATRTKGDFDIRTFEVKARPVAKVDGLRPGMTVTVNWDEIR